MDEVYDLCVIGGGINGAGIARDAAGRGLSVLLVEAKDIAQGTSSASTKLVHGGLRYLEFFEFKLVREALKERERLLSMAPHIISPMRFILPYERKAAGRPYWMMKLGLFLYDHLARRKRVEGSKTLDYKKDDTIFAGLKDLYKQGFFYYDCWVDDARLVLLNAVDAQERGAKILTHTRCAKIEEGEDLWRVTLESDAQVGKTPKKKTISASMVVNAAGPWVNDVLRESGYADNVPSIRHVKGSHLIIPKAFEGDHSYILTQEDGRIVFAIPYEDKYTLIGTTEEAYEGDLYDVHISNDEIKYLCNAFSSHFKTEISVKDVLWTYSGVRPLFDDGRKESRKVSRDFVLHRHKGARLPLVSVYGGKLTTYRVLAEKVVNSLLHLDSRYVNPWTDTQALPGGEFDGGELSNFMAEQHRVYPWLPEALLYRYARSYGTRMDRFLGQAQSLKDLGRNYGGDIYEAELAYMVRYEFVRDLEDALYRRSKLGLHMLDETFEALQAAWPDIVKKANKEE